MSKWCLFAALVFTGPGAAAQGLGDYLNFETPVQSPLEVTTVGGASVLLVCNAQDNSVEVYRATRTPQFLLRVPVGQEPVAIVTRPDEELDGRRRCYTANWLGDSVTSFDLISDGQGGLTYRIHRSEYVGDEPRSIAVLPEIPGKNWSQPGSPNHQSLLVGLSGEGRVAWVKGDSLRPTLISFADIELAAPDGDTAVREPAVVAFVPQTAQAPNVPNTLCVLNFHGGNDPAVYDFDLLQVSDLLSWGLNGHSDIAPIAGIGTANFDMAFAENGDLYVVGQLARNKDPLLTPNFVEAVGEPTMQDLVTNQTGFVTTIVAHVTGVGTGTPTVQVRDLNLEAGGQALQAVTQATGVLVYGDGLIGSRVFTTGFNSDSMGVIELDGSGIAGSPIARVDLKDPVDPFPNANFGGTMNGPRAFALHEGATQDTLYVYNRLSHSVTVVDPAFPLASPMSAVVGQFSLQEDPIPVYMREGRRFAYSSAFSAGNNASCASCHLDGATDLLAWNLSDGIPVPPEGQGLEDAVGPNAAVKGPMVSQPLQGLVNAEIENDDIQDRFFSNRPYHWRGDRGFLEHFNGTFVNLFNTPNPHFVDPNDPSMNQGIPPEEMQMFRDFVFGMVYPPNPEQALDRKPTGNYYDADPETLTDAEKLAQINDPAAGSGGRRGQKLFHQVASDGSVALGTAIACVSCHSLPEGSNNRLTDLRVGFDGFPDQSEPNNVQSLETAQMRGLRVKNKLLIRPDGQGSFSSFPNNDPARTGEFGLIHTGLNSIALTPTISESILNFLLDGFGLPLQDEIDLALYTSEFDSNVGPMIGVTGTLDTATYSADTTLYEAALAAQEKQVEAMNVGLAVHGRIAGVMRGFYYDARDANTPYHEVPRAGVTPIGNFDRAGLLAFIDSGLPMGDPDNALFFHFTPMGSERRIGYLDGGSPPEPSGPAPTGVTLLPSPTMDANDEISKMTTFYLDSVGNIYSNLQNAEASFDFPNLPIVWYQISLTNWAQNVSPPGFGVDQLRHEAPRRFSVAGSGIAQGAVLRLYAPEQSDINTATSTTPPTTTPNPATATIIEMPIYAGRDESGALVWETSAELEPMHVLSFMNGGPNSPLAQLAIDNPRHHLMLQLNSTDLMQPELWNWWWVEVWNEPGVPTTASAGSWQRITLR